MKPALLLIDLQHDYLRAAGLRPAASEVVEQAAALLHGCRSLSIPVLHVWTTVRPADDRRMPHWRERGYWACVEGTEGHATPAPLRPRPEEPVVHKTFFSGFGTGGLDDALGELKVDHLLMAGVHLHACVRATVLDAYQRDYRIWVAEDAVASDDPEHAAVTHRFLEQRCARFLPVQRLLQELAAPPDAAAPGTQCSPSDA